MKGKRLFSIIVLLCCFNGLPAQKAISPVSQGSKVHFVIKNFGFKTGGDFSGLKGTIKFDPKNPAASSFDVTVNAATVDTDNSSRDSHLKKEEYFDVNKYPTIRMQSTRIEGTVKPGRYQFSGKLTIKSTTKPIEFQFTVTEKDGGYLFVSDDIKLNRREYGVGGSSVSLADELRVSLSVAAK